MCALRIMAEQRRDLSNRITDDVDPVVGFCREELVVDVAPGRGLAVRSLADQAGVPDHVGCLVRRHQDGLVEIEVTCLGADVALVRIDRLHLRIGHMHDDVRIQLLEGLLIAGADRRQTRFRIQDHHLARNLLALEDRGNEAGALIGRRRAAVRRRRHGHHQRAALEGMHALLQRQHLAVGQIGAGIVHARVVDRALVVAEPHVEGIADATGQDQVVVVQPAHRGLHPALVALEGHHLGLQQRVAPGAGRTQDVAVDEIRAHHVRQPLVAHRPRPEGRVAIHQDHVGLRDPLTQVAGRREPAPAASADDDAWPLATTGNEAALARDHGRCGRCQRRQGRRSGQHGSQRKRLTAFHDTDSYKTLKRQVLCAAPSRKDAASRRTDGTKLSGGAPTAARTARPARCRMPPARWPATVWTARTAPGRWSSPWPPPRPAP